MFQSGLIGQPNHQISVPPLAAITVPSTSAGASVSRSVNQHILTIVNDHSNNQANHQQQQPPAPPAKPHRARQRKTHPPKVTYC